MARKHLEWLRSADVAEEQVVDGPLAGLVRRMLSEDDSSGASTALLRAQADWTGRPGSLMGCTEIFVVAGTVTVGDVTFGRLGYALLATDTDVIAAAGAEFLLMADPERAGDVPTDALVIDGEALEWEKELHGAPPAVGVKVFRSAEESGPVTLLVGNVPHYDSGPEFHECPEEIFILEGDVGNETVSVRARDYLWRPAYITHGPYRSDTGLLVFLRGHGELTAHWMDNRDATVEDNIAYAAGLRQA
jgi:hypothetical protein